jgi:hypothetical protein
VGAILADLVPAKGLHPDWLPLLRQSFPAEFPAASRTAD